MKALNVQVAHGWRTEGQGEESIRVDYYAIGSPELSRLVVSVSLDEDNLQRVNAHEEHTHLAQLQADTIADYAAIWAAQYAYPGQMDESVGGGEMLSDEAVTILASYHPDWFMSEDLCHILSAIDEDEDLDDDLSAAREDLRIFVEAIRSLPRKEGEGKPMLRRFPLGRTVATPGGLAALAEAGQSPMEFLARHVCGDWGEVDEYDAQENEFSIENDLRLLSAYTLRTGVKIWIITEADRSVTTILLPNEY